MALLGMGANVQSNGYFPGYYSTRDLIFDSEGCTWTSSNVNSELKNNCYLNGSLPESSPCNSLGYNKEFLKQTILKHEAIFRDQVHELHRVYNKQRELMEGVKRNELYKHNLSLEASWSGFPLSPKNAQKICCSPNLPWPTGQSSGLIAESMQMSLASAQEKSTQLCPAPAPTVNEESLKDSKLSENKYRRVGKKILDLQLPADEYIDSEEGECLENERVIEFPQVSVYSLNGMSHEKPHGTNFNFEEEATRAYDLRGPTHSRRNSFYDVTKLHSQNFPNDVVQNINKKQVSPENPSRDQEKNHKQLSSGQRGGVLDSFAKDIYSEKQSVSVGSLSENMKQFNYPPLHQNNKGPWTERKLPSNESSTRTQGSTSNGLLGPSSASHICDLYPFVSGADTISSRISPTELCKTHVSNSRQIPMAVQALPCFSTSASPGESSKSLMGISGFTKDELYHCTSVKPKPNLDGQNGVLSSSFCNRSKLLDLPSINSANDPNSKDYCVSSDRHELRKYIMGYEDHVGTSNSLNLNITPAGYSDTKVFQSIQTIGEENKSKKDSTRGLPWLDEKHACKGKPKEESKVSTQSESSVHNLKSKKTEETDLSMNKTLDFHCNGKPHMVQSDLQSFHVFPSEVFHNRSSKIHGTEEIDKGCVSIVNSPCIYVPELREQVPDGEHSMKDEQKRHDSSLAGIIDLNSCMFEEEDMPVEVDFQAPESPENKECSPPRGESDENQVDMPFQSAEQEDREVLEEQARTAAEALVSISGFAAQNGLQTTTCSSSESFVSSPLHWFAGMVSIMVDHPDNENKVNDLEEFLPADMDYFEFMTLNLSETKDLDCCCKSIGQTEQVGGSTSSLTQARRKGRTNRGRWRKDFQSEILPSLSSLSRYEVSEDLQTIGSLVAAAGTHSETGSLRSASRNSLSKGKKRSSTSTCSNISDLVLNLKRLTSITELVDIEKGSRLMSWGKTCRKRRGQRVPTTNPHFTLNQVYNSF